VLKLSEMGIEALIIDSGNLVNKTKHQESYSSLCKADTGIWSDRSCPQLGQLDLHGLQ